MRIKAKLVHKYDIQSGISQNTGNPWKRQDMKFVILRDDYSETSETVVASCNNETLLGAPALCEGAKGILSVWMDASEYNGRCYQRVNMNGWTPQSETQQAVAQQMAQPEAPQLTPEQLAQAAAVLKQQGGTKLPF